MEILNPTQSDADVCNLLDAPTKGVHVGQGIHCVIPDDWQKRILAGEQVEGCTYHTLQDRDTGKVDDKGELILETVLVLSDVVQAKVIDPAEVTKLDPKQQADADALAAKIQEAALIVSAAVDEIEDPRKP